MKFIKILWGNVTNLNTISSLGKNREDFIKEICFLNFNRLKLFATLIFLISTPLVYFDLQRIHSEISSIKTGGKIVFYSRLAVALITIISIILAHIKNIEDHKDIVLFHKLLIRISYFMLLLSFTFMAAGDFFISGSIIVFFGTIFTFSVLTLLTNIYSIFLYFINSSLLFIFIGYISIEKEILL
ncbi:MAG: hypothetical protein ABFR75_10885, partial [Acidobacteriota bacterium]